MRSVTIALVIYLAMMFGGVCALEARAGSAPPEQQYILNIADNTPKWVQWAGGVAAITSVGATIIALLRRRS